MAVVCALAIAGEAHADRIGVAVIDLSGEPEAGTLTERIYAELGRQPDLGTPKTRTFDSALSGPLLDEDGPHIRIAMDDKKHAEDLLAQFRLGEATEAAQAGETELVDVVPTPEVVALYADLSLLLGQGKLANRDANGATRAFALTRRLDPMKHLDPAIYLPEVVTVFDNATTPPGKVKLEVAGAGRLWIDGIERGTAPATIEVNPGDHLIQLTGDDRESRGKRVLVPDDGPQTIDEAPIDDVLRVRRTRLALARAVDPAARAGAMRQLARLLDVHDAVLITKTADGKLEVQTWKDRAPGFSALRVHENERPAELLEPLIPPREAEPPRTFQPPLPPRHVEAEPAWYEKRWVQASAIGGVVIGVIGAYLLATRVHHVAGPGMIGNGDTP